MHDPFARLLEMIPGQEHVEKGHARTIAQALKTEKWSGETSYHSVAAPQRTHCRSLVGLKGICLRDLDISRDYVVTGRVLTVTIIEPPVCLVGIYFIVADENEDAERLAIYNLPGEFPSNCDQDSIGTEVCIIEPYMRHSADGSRTIRVDEPSSVMITGDRRHNVCRYCGKGDTLHRCGRCHKASYCDRTCQVNDWKLLGHKCICGGI